MAYAVSTDVEARLGRELEESEIALVEARLGDAELIIRSRIPDLDDKITDNVISLETVVMVEADAVLRLVKNPDGFTSETDGNYTYQIRWDSATGRISILEDEWRVLGLKRGFAILGPTIAMPFDYTCTPGENPDTAVWG